MGLKVFSQQAGQVAVIDTGLPALISIGLTGGNGDTINYRATKSIVTRVAFSGQPNVQFMHTVGGSVHIYVFGDRVGAATVSGLAFGAHCDQTNKLGIESVKEFYEQNKVSAQRNPVSISLGKTVLRGVLIGINADVSDPKTNVWQFGLQIATVPPRPKWNAAAPDAGAGGRAIAAPARLSASSVRTPTGSAYYPVPTTTPADQGGALAAGAVYNLPATIDRAAFGAGPVTNLANGFTVA